MSTLPQIDKLDMFEVYAFYDRPVLFSCFDKYADRMFLVVFLGEKEFCVSWMLAEVSSPRLFDIRAGLISLRDAFEKTEDGFVFKLTCPPMAPQIIERISAVSLDSELLPEVGEKLRALRGHSSI